MRKTLVRRCTALLFAPVLTLLLICTTALAAQGGTFTIKTNHDTPWTKDHSDTFTVVEDENGNTGIPSGKLPIWESSDESVATIDDTGRVMPLKAGTTVIRAYYIASDGSTRVYSNSVTITVSGLAAEPIEVEENGTATLSVTPLGDALNYGISYAVPGDDSNYFISIRKLSSGAYEVTGKNIGSTTVTASAGPYDVTFTVTVIPDPSTEIKLDDLKNGETLPFSDLISKFSSQIGGKVQYVTGLFVPTDQGTLYYEYRSEAEPGAGVGQSENYYLSAQPGQRKLSDVTFVPKLSYPGGNVTINYNAVTGEGRTYACKITFKLIGGSGGDDSQPGVISTQTEYGTALKFDSQEFGAICRERLGVQLDYVIFAQPPERQGALYTNYSSADSYGSLVNVHQHYSRREIDDISFVPAPGYSGSVTVYYTGFGTNGRSYSGQVIIKVAQEDSVSTGGLSYNTSPGGAARFNDEDFDDYCYEILGRDASQTLSAIRFESLPSESDGILYYDYQSSGNTGIRAEVGTVYYYGTRAPRIDRLAFVPAEDFIGTLKLPFTGWTMDGTSFSGNVEINVSGSAVSGDIYYYCLPGGTASFISSDFTTLSRTMTNRTLDYIRFRGMPNTSEGYLYYGNARVSSIEMSYTSGNISRLSFRASNSFSGLVNIPFEGRSTGGDTFTGVITIGDGGSGSGGAGTSSSPSTADVTARYSTRTEPVRFYASDLAQSGASLSTIRFTSLPSSGTGYLYYQYLTPIQYGRQVSTGTTYQASGDGLISDVVFVPRAGYSGTAVIPYTGTNSNGSTFTGEIQIYVAPNSSSYYFSDMAGYSSSQLAAVDFLYDHGITHGLVAGEYGPENSIRRGDFALMLYQAFEFSPALYNGAFADVASDAYYAQAVNSLYANGVVSGIGNGHYAPNSTLTRQDAICMVQRAMGAVGWNADDGYTGALTGYSDGENVSGYAQGAMAMAVQRGYLPTSGGWLNPQLALSRVDMAEILHRALTY